ncbi:MAG: hypothetical protein EP312_04240 [Gammaproteobacteria bacterium]|nr:MAG: hypothetical protein EP312_04240 [Gammaproteobacteria bacterium]
MRFEARPSTIAWMILVILAVAVLWQTLSSSQRLPVQTNMLALLPAAEQDPVAALAVSTANEHLSRQHLLLIGAGRSTDAIAIAEPLIARLQQEPVFTAVHARVDTSSGESIARFYAPYRNALLSPELQQRVQANGVAVLSEQALHTLFSPASAIHSSLLANDPLLLFYDFLLSLGNSNQRIRLEAGYPFIHYAGRDYLLIRLELADSPFSINAQQQALPALDAALLAARTQDPAAELLDTGVLRFADAGVRSAKQEVSTIGAGSLIGVVLLFLWVFRSGWPLLLTVLPIASGFVVALAACLRVFGDVHLMTLVFGASLIGLSVDYSLHFLIDRQASDANWQAGDSLRRMGRGLWLGVASSVTAFMALCLTPFPGMQQMALFCSAGLVTAALTVTGVFPLLLRHGAPGTAPGLGMARQWLQLWQSPLRLAITIVIVVALALPGLMRLHSNDDIRLLQGKPPALLASDARIREITGIDSSGAFLLVEGESEATVLQRNDAASDWLRQQQQAGHISGFDSLSRQLPSPARQQQAAAWLASLPQDPAALAYAAQIGLDPATLAVYTQPASPLTVSDWLANDVSLPWRKLWLGETARGFATMIPVRGSTAAPINEALPEGTRWIDPVADMSGLLETYRERASGVVMAAFALIALLLVLRYRPRRALAAMAPALLAATCALAVAGWLDEPVTVFHLLALLLVLGFGLDYSLFLLENREHPQSTMLAILCSGLTTLLSFGLLALSSTPAIHAFGIIVLTGIATTLLFAPIVQTTHNEVLS